MGWWILVHMRMYIKTGKILNCSGALVPQRAGKWTTITSTIGTGSHACIEIEIRATLSSLSIWLAAWIAGRRFCNMVAILQLIPSHVV